MAKLETLRELDYSSFFAEVPSGYPVWPDAVGYALKHRPTIYDGRVSACTTLINAKSEADVYGTVATKFVQADYSRVMDSVIMYIQNSTYTKQQEEFNTTLAGGLSMFLNIANIHAIMPDLEPLNVQSVKDAVNRAVPRDVLKVPIK